MTKKEEEAVKNEDMGLKVIVADNMIRVEDGDRYVEGKKKPNFGIKRKMQNFMSPKKLTVQGGEDATDKPVTMHLDDYASNKDLDLFILDKMLTDWSKKERVTWSNILADEEVGDLMEEFVEKFKEINDLVKSKEKEEKKSE